MTVNTLNRMYEVCMHTREETGWFCGDDHVVMPLADSDEYQNSNGFLTARRNARIARAVLATAISSVCPSVRPSVSDTCRCCVKMTARSTVLFALSDSKMCLVL